MQGGRAKRWGEYQVKRCVFCKGVATQKNNTGLEVCRHHTKSVLDEIKCSCGQWLEQREGKFGAYFNCLRCGNMSVGKVVGMGTVKGVDIDVKNKKSGREKGSAEADRERMAGERMKGKSGVGGRELRLLSPAEIVSIFEC